MGQRLTAPLFFRLPLVLTTDLYTSSLHTHSQAQRQREQVRSNIASRQLEVAAALAREQEAYQRAVAQRQADKATRVGRRGAGGGRGGAKPCHRGQGDEGSDIWKQKYRSRSAHDRVPREATRLQDSPWLRRHVGECW